MSRESKLVKNTFILSIGTFLPKLATFITLPILTAYLSKEQYGTYDLVTILVSLVLPVTTLQIHTAGFRFLIEHKNDRDLAKLYLSNILAFVIPVSLISLILLYIFIPIEDSSIKLWVCIYLFFDTIVAEIRQITRGMGKNLYYSISSIISALVKMGLAVLLVQVLKYELKGAIIALALSPIISILYLVFRIRVFDLVSLKLVSKKVLKEMLAYSWPMVPNNMSSWVMRVSDRFVVTGFMGLSANAVYAVANKIPNLLTLAQSTFSMAWQESASISSKDGDVGKYYSKMFVVMTNFYAGCLGLIIASTPLLFRILVKGDYSEAYPQMPVLFLAVFFASLSGFLGGIYIACKATKSVGITTVLAALCNLVIDLALINAIGLYAASGSTLISYLFLFIYRMINVRKLVDIHYDMPKFYLAIAVITIESILCYINTVPVNIVNVCFGVIAFCFLNKGIIAAIWSKIQKKTKKKKNRM